MRSLNARSPAYTVGAVTDVSSVLREVFDSLCRAAAAEVPDSNMQEVVDALWTTSTTSRALPEVCGSLC